MLLAKAKLNTIKFLVSKASNHSYKSHDKFVSANNVIREYNEMKEENQKSWECFRMPYLKKQWKPVVLVVVLEKLNERY